MFGLAGSKTGTQRVGVAVVVKLAAGGPLGAALEGQVSNAGLVTCGGGGEGRYTEMKGLKLHHQS